MELTRRQQLLEKFKVEASFYRMKVGEEYLTFRNQARVIRKGYEGTNQYDAVVMMVNPGACNAINKDYSIPEMDPRKEDIPFVEANSDQTQEQLMRLMDIRDWNHLVIINLSDICSGNLNVFFSNLKKAKECSLNYHSILSSCREKELDRILSNNNGPMIAGWGTKPSIKGLAMDALENSLLNPFVGWKHEKSPYFYHPKPRSQENRVLWLQKIDQILGGQDENAG